MNNSGCMAYLQPAITYLLNNSRKIFLENIYLMVFTKLKLFL